MRVARGLTLFPRSAWSEQTPGKLPSTSKTDRAVMAPVQENERDSGSEAAPLVSEARSRVLGTPSVYHRAFLISVLWQCRTRTVFDIDVLNMDPSPGHVVSGMPSTMSKTLVHWVLGEDIGRWNGLMMILSRLSLLQYVSS